MRRGQLIALTVSEPSLDADIGAGRARPSQSVQLCLDGPRDAHSTANAPRSPRCGQAILMP